MFSAPQLQTDSFMWSVCVCVYVPLLRSGLRRPTNLSRLAASSEVCVSSGCVLLLLRRDEERRGEPLRSLSLRLTRCQRHPHNAPPSACSFSSGGLESELP